MLNLPLELIELIVSPLENMENDDVLALCQVCRQLRMFTLPQLLVRHGLLMPQVYSGRISLPGGAYFLLPIIYRIQPIQVLTILPTRRRGPPELHLRLGVLTSVLREIPPIPDISIETEPGPQWERGISHRHAGIARLLVALSRNGQDPLAIAGSISEASKHLVVVGSSERRAPQDEIVGGPTPGFVGVLILALAALLAPHIFIPFLLFIILVCIRNTYVLVDWLCRHLLGPSLPQTCSHRAGLGFTLVTFPLSTGLIIRPLPTTAEPTAILHSLDLGQKLRSLTIDKNCALDLPAVLGFIRRHESLDRLNLTPGALCSPLAELSAHGGPQQLRRLTAPPNYLLHILPAEGGFVELNITPINNLSQLSHAFAAIAALPGSDLPLRRLELRIKGVLPWRVNHDVEADVSLRSVRRLFIEVECRFRTEDVDRLPEWLMQFPALVHLQIRGYLPSLIIQKLLGQAIVERRKALLNVEPWEGISFT
ncbi:hypothetical protein C8R46DRAFT_1106296 [Mycena filopes]|nr:hypothetical protein C8R46DRAFT_1106296 [Mycena filopes]